ncbi:MAG: hypothetical protein E7H36_10165 [Bifidobacterium dentium]|nr:hypothetical protein [Bifidobacterium dentium]
MLAAIRLMASYRTLETRQAHRLDPSVPGSPSSAFWLDMLGAGLCEPGFPIAVDGRQAASPYSAAWMAVRLPVHGDILPRLDAFDATPPELATLAPCREPGSKDWRPNLRGQRQYDRHNLICTQLACARAAEGWRTLGESLAGKFDRWERVLRHPGTKRVHVIWLAAARSDTGIPSRLAALSAPRRHQHWAAAEDWLSEPTCADGYAPEPGAPPEPYDWMAADMDRVGDALGLPHAGSWRRPRVLMGAARDI